MDTCLLCLQEPSSFNSYIPINRHVLHMIEKHFWPIDDLQSALGVCCLCWAKLNDFHIFYEEIEAAHRTVTEIFNEEKFKYCSIEPEITEIPIHFVRKPDPTKIEEEEIIVDDFDDVIKIENSLDECETICYPPITSEQVHSLPISIEKRKRGRPRKAHNKHEIIVKKPKGKRGRPRKNINSIHTKMASYRKNFNKTSTNNELKGKRGRPRKNILENNGKHTQMASYGNNYNKSLTSNDLMQQLNYPKELETAPQSAFITTIRNGNPLKKRGRGRPRKLKKISENSQTIKEVSELAIPDNVVSVRECSKSQDEELINGQLSNLNEKTVNKNRNIFSLMKKRKRIQQHKTIMRNYIATSVRCMKFFKK